MAGKGGRSVQGQAVMDVNHQVDTAPGSFSREELRVLAVAVLGVYRTMVTSRAIDDEVTLHE
jgi:hypothetical protein